MPVKGARTSKELVEAARTCMSESNFSPAKAGNLLTSAVQQDPTFVNALVLRSNLASRLGQLTAATADLSLAIEMDRGSTDTRRVASLYGSRSSLLARAGRHADAIADLRAALKCEPDNGTWAFELGRAYLREGRVNLAQMHFQQVLQEPMWSHINESMRPKLYALYGRSCLMSRDYKKAKALLHKSLEVGGDGAAVLHDVGLAHYHEGTALASALDFFARATEMDPQPVEYPMHLGLTHTRCGNFKDALSSMNEAVLRGRELSLLRFYRGCIELQLSLGPQALVDLQDAAEQHVGATGSNDSSVGAKKVEGTVGKGAALLTPAPSSSFAAAWIAMALVHLFCGKSLDMSALCLAEALRRELDPQERTLAGTLLGIVLHQQNKTLEALRTLSDVVTAMKISRRYHNIGNSGDNTSVSNRKASSFDVQFDADMELLVLTHVGLVYGACGYADLALRFFAQARQRAQQRGDAAQRASCFFREAVALAELRDDWGALETLQLSSMAVSSTCMFTATNRVDAPGQRDSPSQKSISVTLTATDVSGATLTFSSGGSEGAEGHKKVQSSQSRQQQRSANAQRGSSSLASASFLTLHQLSSGETAHLYAVTLRRLGRLSEALQYATAAVDAQAAGADSAGAAAAVVVTEVPAYRYNRALIHFCLHNYADAMNDVQVCIQAINARDDGDAHAAASADPYYLQGCIAHATGNFTGALDSLTTALAVDATLRASPVFSYSHGVLLAIAGQHEAAIDAFSAAIQHGDEAVVTGGQPAEGKRGDGGPLRCPAVYYHERAKVYQQLGRYAEALADYNCVLPKARGEARLSPTATGNESTQQEIPAVNWNALVNRALTLKELRRYDEAAVDWDAALRLDKSGCLAQFTSQDVFEIPYVELCLPGCELNNPVEA